MTAGRVDLVCEQGASFTRKLTWLAGEQPVDLTGWQARMQVRSDYGADTTVLELTDANGRIALGGAEGTITLALTAAETAALAVETGPGPRRLPPRVAHVYDLELIAPGGAVTRLIQGLFMVHGEVTR